MFWIFFLSDERLAGFSVFSQLFCDSRSFKASEVFRGLSVTQGLSPCLSRLTTNRLKGFFFLLNMWGNQLWQSHQFKESVRCIRQMSFLIWRFRCWNSYLCWIDVSVNMSEVFFTSVTSQQKCQKKRSCRTIITLFRFSWKWINPHVKHAKNRVTYLSNLENTANDYLS